MQTMNIGLFPSPNSEARLTLDEWFLHFEPSLDALILRSDVTSSTKIHSPGGQVVYDSVFFSTSFIKYKCINMCVLNTYIKQVVYDSKSFPGQHPPALKVASNRFFF